MALTVRIDEATHAALREFAERDCLSLQDELTKLVKARQELEFFAAIQRGYAAVSPAERAEDQADLAAWDQTLSDGLADE
jgi:hypothetical protein